MLIMSFPDPNSLVSASGGDEGSSFFTCTGGASGADFCSNGFCFTGVASIAGFISSDGSFFFTTGSCSSFIAGLVSSNLTLTSLGSCFTSTAGVLDTFVGSSTAGVSCLKISFILNETQNILTSASAPRFRGDCLAGGALVGIGGALLLRDGVAVGAVGGPVISSLSSLASLVDAFESFESAGAGTDDVEGVAILVDNRPRLPFFTFRFCLQICDLNQRKKVQSLTYR